MNAGPKKARAAAGSNAGTVLLVMLKAPRPGFVKTRLAREIGVEAATRIYRAMAERQLQAVPPEFRVEVHYAPRGAGPEMRRWLGPGYRYRRQADGDLGRRLTHAFGRGLRRGEERAIAIGADCPGLGADILLEAERRLARADVILGPAADGGYYLIGLRRPEPRLFQDIAWSTDAVLRQTRDRAAECGLRCELLPVREDIDDWPALRRYLEAEVDSSLRTARGDGGP